MKTLTPMPRKTKTGGGTTAKMTVTKRTRSTVYRLGRERRRDGRAGFEFWSTRPQRASALHQDVDRHPVILEPFTMSHGSPASWAGRPASSTWIPSKPSSDMAFQRHRRQCHHRHHRRHRHASDIYPVLDVRSVFLCFPSCDYNETKPVAHVPDCAPSLSVWLRGRGPRKLGHAAKLRHRRR